MSITESAPVPPPSGFDSGAAAFHVFAHARREGWAPLLKLGAIYFVAGLAAMALLLLALWPFLAMVFDPALTGSADPKLAAARGMPPGFWQAFGLSMIGYLAYLAFYLVFYAVIDAALLRWLLGRGARPKLGGDELRLILISLLWCVLPFVLFAPFWVLLFIAAAAGSASAAAGWSVGVLCFLAFIGACVAWTWLAARLAPAAALTVRDGRLRAFGGWAATAGRFWPVLGGFFIVWVIYVAASFGIQILVQPLMLLAGGDMFAFGAAMDPDSIDPQEVLAVLLSPAMIAISAISAVISVVIAFLFQAMLAGANVYLARQPAG